MCGVTKEDNSRNEHMKRSVNVESVVNRITEKKAAVIRTSHYNTVKSRTLLRRTFSGKRWRWRRIQSGKTK